MTKSPLRSAAQHRMLKRAASDHDYAKERGVAPSLAQALLDEHIAAGAPDLPERVEAAGPSPPSPRKPRTYKLLGAR